VRLYLQEAGLAMAESEVLCGLRVTVGLPRASVPRQGANRRTIGSYFRYVSADPIAIDCTRLIICASQMLTGKSEEHAPVACR